MKTFLLPGLKLTLILIILCGGIYPLVIAGISIFSPGGGDGIVFHVNGRVVGYENIGQKFNRDNYFWGRPSAVGYNAAGSGGSNKGPSNPEYIASVKQRIDTFLVHNPGIHREDIPADLVTQSGSGLDPDISIKAATIQVPRIAHVRNLSEKQLYELIDNIKSGPFLGLFGPEKINVLKLNAALNQIKN